jgi:hypothetical protein
VIAFVVDASAKISNRLKLHYKYDTAFKLVLQITGH